MNMRQTFGCNDCNYPRTKKQKLIRHMKRVHMKIKDFKCEQCGYTCSKKQYLDRHIKPFRFGREHVKFWSLVQNRNGGQSEYLLVDVDMSIM